MAQKLLGKVAVITGAGSQIGIGKETALAMAAEGAKVVVNDIVKDLDGGMGADRVVKQIKEAKGTAVANYDSITSMEGGQKIIKTAIDNFGRIDILVNTAGNFITMPTVDYTEAMWDAIMAVHLKGAFACTQAALKEMIKQKSGGRIINFTSIAAFSDFLGPGPSVAYCAAKAGILGFTKLLSAEMRQYGITVNVISPGASTTLFPPGLVKVNGVPLPPGPGPEFVAPVLVYLATDEAKDITGRIIASMGGDITVFAPPMGAGGAHHYMHKTGKWTVDELIQLMPRAVGGGEGPGKGK
jgi:NAD(P)-dependent dehydrogenase (short-subunit alcohol dehydrogenase family)